MLILTRRSDESIIIGNDIEVKILRIQGNQVHVGITAPRSISVYRHELYEQVISENKKAVQANLAVDNLANLERSLGSFQKLINKNPASEDTGKSEKKARK